MVVRLHGSAWLCGHDRACTPAAPVRSVHSGPEARCSLRRIAHGHFAGEHAWRSKVVRIPRVLAWWCLHDCACTAVHGCACTVVRARKGALIHTYLHAYTHTAHTHQTHIIHTSHTHHRHITHTLGWVGCMVGLACACVHVCMCACGHVCMWACVLVG